MKSINFFRMSDSDWQTAFYANDCTNTKLVLLGVTNIKTTVWLTYVTLAICTGYMYGRHKGINPYKYFDDMLNDKEIESKMINYASKSWFVSSTFIFPWYLCIIWLYYSIYFNDIHYINTYNPWILPIIVTYMLYSITVIISFAYYSKSHNRCSYICVKVTLILYGILALFMTFILFENRNNNLSNFSFSGFYGNDMLHCVDFTTHINPIIISIFAILYLYTTHHIFVCLRAFAATFCNGKYLSKTELEGDEEIQIQKKQKKHRNNAHIYNKNKQSEGNGFNIDIDEHNKSDINEYDEYNDSEEDNSAQFNDYYMRNRCGNRQNCNRKKSKYLNEPNAATPEPQLMDLPNQIEL